MNYRILTDDAITEDKSRNQTHKNIAERLYSVISDSATPGLTIGLEGKWGSGKSTVIKILNEKLKKEEETFVFYIDTWAHEGDPLRRVFLESFIEEIIQQFPKLSDKKKETLDEIQGKVQYRQKTTIISKIPEIDFAGKITTALAFLVPLGTVMVDHSFDSLTFERGYPLNWSFIFGCLFMIAPLLASVIFNLKGMRFFKTKETDSTKEVSNEEEKSSVDFNIRFVELQDFLVSQLNIKKIICVIDNLDRIKEEDALKIWSTLQTFVQGKNSNVNSVTDKVKFFVLVPYDEQGLRKLWSKESENQSCSNSFFNKNFQLRIYVPQLIVSDWIDFAKKQIDEALFSYKVEEKQDILNVFECTRESLGDAPTLREIKIYINQIAFLYPLHKKNSSLKALCYYVVLKYLKFKDYDTILNDLRKGKIPDASMEIYCDKQDLTKELCSILFMVSKDEGMQLLLQEPIQKAILENPAELESLKEVHGESFFTVLEYILAVEKEIDICECVINLYSFLKLKEEYEFEILKQFINKDSVQTRIFSDVCKYSADFWKIYVELTKNNTECIAYINDYFSNNTEKLLVQQNTKNDFVYILYNVILSLGEFCSINIDYAKIGFVGYEKIYNDLTEQSNVVFECVTNFNSLDEDISARINDDKSDKEKLLQMIKLQIDLHKTNEWSNSLCIVYNNLAKAPNSKAVFLSNLLILKELQRYKYLKEDDESTRKILNSQNLWSNIYFVNDLDDRYILYNLFYKYVDDILNFTIQPLGNSQNSINDAKNILKSIDAEIAKYFYGISKLTDDYTHYWRLVNNPAYKLIGNVIKLAADEKNKQFFSVSNPYKNLRDAVKLVGKDYEVGIVKAFIEYSGLEREFLDNVSFEYSKYPDISIEIIEQTKNINVIKKLSDEILLTDENEWLDFFSSRQNVLNVPLALYEKTNQFNLGENYYKAFVKSVIDKANSCDIDSKKLNSLFKIMGKNWKKEVSNQMEKKLLTLKFLVSPQVKLFCLDSIKLSYIIKEHKTDFSDFIKTYIDEKKEDVLQFIVNMIKVSNEKFYPEEHYSEILKSSVEKLQNAELKDSLSKIFNIKSSE